MGNKMNDSKKLSKNIMILFQLLIVISIIPMSGIEASLNTPYVFPTNDADSSTKNVLLPTSVLTSGSINQSYKPEVFVDSSNNIHVAWQEEYSTLPDRIHYTTWNAASKTWSSLKIVNEESDGDGYNPTLAVDDVGNVFIAWDDRGDIAGSGTDADIFFRIWNASTSTWSGIEVVSVGDTTTCYRPSLGIDSNNNVHISWMNYESVPAPLYAVFNIFYNFRDAATGTWNGTEILSVTTLDYSQNPSLVVDKSDNVHIVWRTSVDNYDGSGADADIVYRSWNAATDSWSTTDVISTESTGDSYYPFIALDGQENIHCVWHDSTDYNSAGIDSDIFYKYWNAITETWSITEVISTESTEDSEYPRVAVDNEDSIRIAWKDETNYENSGTDSDIFYKYWDVGSSSWSDTEVISTESNVVTSLKTGLDSVTILAEADYSTTPSLALDVAGNFYIVWADYTDYLGSGDQDSDIFFRKTISFTAPVLESISPNPSTTGNITLNWNDVEYATTYYLYRSQSTITSVDGLTPIATLPTTTYEDLSLLNGTYYYAVVASMELAESYISNVESVEVAIPEIPEPDDSGFQLGVSSVFIGMTISIIALITKRRRK